MLEFKPPKNIPWHVQGLNYGEGIYELEDHVGEEASSLNFVAKAWARKTILHVGFSNHPLENI